MGTSKSTWKKAESRIAKFFGSVRAALSGGNGKITRSDSLHPDLFIETKLRERISAVTLWDQTAKLAKKEGKIPVVALCQKGRKGFWVVCHCDDLVDIGTCREVALSFHSSDIPATSGGK